VNRVGNTRCQYYDFMNLVAKFVVADTKFLCLHKNTQQEVQETIKFWNTNFKWLIFEIYFFFSIQDKHSRFPFITICQLMLCRDTSVLRAISYGIHDYTAWEKTQIFKMLQQVLQVLSGLTYRHCNCTKIKFLSPLTYI
jgi:hypothetical protein